MVCAVTYIGGYMWWFVIQTGERWYNLHSKLCNNITPIKPSATVAVLIYFVHEINTSIMENFQFCLQISCMPFRPQYLQYGNTGWLIWRRSGRWWLEHDWPGTTEAYPSSFFPFHRKKKRKETKSEALALLLRPYVSTNNHLKSVNNPPCWGENYFKDLQGAKEAWTNTGALSRWGGF